MSCCGYISKDPTSSQGWRHLTLRLRPACLGTSGGCGHGVPPTYRRAMDIDSLQRQCWQCWQGWRGWKIECVWIINSKKNRIEPLNQTETYVFRFFAEMMTLPSTDFNGVSSMAPPMCPCGKRRHSFVFHLILLAVNLRTAPSGCIMGTKVCTYVYIYMYHMFVMCIYIYIYIYIFIDLFAYLLHSSSTYISYNKAYN